MKMNTNAIPIERSSSFGESTFKIAESAKAFEILSSGLYTDPVMAVVRELSCNAYDAHVSAGKKGVPFEIHLPSVFEPWFSVKDQGTGLSDEQVRGVLTPMMTFEDTKNDDGTITRREIPVLDDNGQPVMVREGGLYTTYFLTTKDESNDEIGAFGLGCKSPYSYTESYQVTSWHNHVKRVYGLFLNEERLPTVALMSEISTTEPNGIEVRMAVQEKDFQTFRNKVSSGLRFFDPKPTILNCGSFVFNALPATKFSGDGWVVSEAGRQASGSFTVVMGQVPYYVNHAQLAPHIPNGVATFLKRLNIISYFDIGDLDLPPNREEVRYTDRTLQALITRVNDIRKNFVHQIEKQVSDLTDPTFWKKYQEISRISRDLFGNSTDIITFLEHDTKQADILLYCNAAKTGGLIVPGPLTCHSVTKMNNVTGRRAKIHINLEKSTSTMDFDFDDEGNRITPTIQIKPKGSTLVVYNDLNRGGISRLKKYIASVSSHPEQIFVINKLTVKNMMNVDWAHDLSKANHKAELDKILNALGNPPVITLSTFKNPTKTTYSKRPLPIYKYGGWSYTRRARVISWNSGHMTEDMITNGGLYFFLDRGKELKDHHDRSIPWGGNGFEENMQATLRIINEVTGSTYKVSDIVGVSTLTRRKIAENKKWRNVFAVAEDLLSSHNDLVHIYRDQMQTDDILGFKTVLFNFNQLAARESLVSSINGLDDKSVMKTTLMPLVDASEKLKNGNFEKIKAIAKFEDGLRLNKYNAKPLIVGNLVAKLRSQYPMLTFVSFIQDNQYTKFFEYISLVDRS